MAAERNNITLIGALAEPPTLTETKSGRNRTLITVAGTDASLTTDGRPRSIRWWHRVSIVGPQADSLANLQPGTVLLVQDTLRSRDNKQEDGPRRQRVEVYGQHAHTTPHPGKIITDDGGRHYLEGGTNQTTLEGTLARDIQVRHTQAGVLVARSTLVTNLPQPSPTPSSPPSSSGANSPSSTPTPKRACASNYGTCAYRTTSSAASERRSTAPPWKPPTPTSSTSPAPPTPPNPHTTPHHRWTTNMFTPLARRPRLDRLTLAVPGPAGSGKSTFAASAQELPQRLLFLDL